MEWFKFYGKDFLTDLKLQDLEWYDQLCFVYLMCYASQSTLPRNEIRDLTEKRFFKVLHFDSETVDNASGFLGRLEALHFIEINPDGGVVLPNFEKRQARAMTPYERVKRHREKKKGEMITHDNGDNANDNARVEKRREEKKRIDTTIRGGKPPKVSAQEVLSPEDSRALGFMTWWNKQFGTNFSNYKNLSKNLQHWLTIYSPLEICTAAVKMKQDKFWKPIITPQKLLRRKTPKGEDCDHIGEFLNGEEPEEPMSKMVW